MQFSCAACTHKNLFHDKQYRTEEHDTRGDIMKKFVSALLVTLALLSVPAPSIHGNPDYAKVQIDTRHVASAKELVKRSPLIVSAWCDTAFQEIPTPLRVEGRKVVKFTQTMHVKNIIKGKASRLITLISEGVDPLPDSSSPLNKRYPGPLAEGDYLCFLQPIPNSNLYSLVGLWQGVYPMYDGKPVALEGFGFPQFNNLTPSDLRKMIKELEQQP